MTQGHSKIIRVQLLATASSGLIYGIVDRRVGRRQNHDTMVARGYLAGVTLSSEPSELAEALVRLAQDLVAPH